MFPPLILAFVALALSVPIPKDCGYLLACPDTNLLFKLVVLQKSSPKLHNKEIALFNSTLGVFPSFDDVNHQADPYNVIIQTPTPQVDGSYGPAPLMSSHDANHQLALVSPADATGIYTLTDILKSDEPGWKQGKVILKNAWVMQPNGTLKYKVPKEGDIDIEKSTDTSVANNNILAFNEQAGWYAFPIGGKLEPQTEDAWEIKWLDRGASVVVQIGIPVEIQMVEETDMLA